MGSLPQPIIQGKVGFYFSAKLQTKCNKLTEKRILPVTTKKANSGLLEASAR